MTKFERKRTADRLLSRFENEGQRRVSIQHGHSEQFGNGSNRTMKLSDDPGAGWLPGQTGIDPNDSSSSIIDAAISVQAIIDGTDDEGLADGLRSILACLNALSLVPKNSLTPKVQQAKVNRTPTEPARFVPSNTASRTGSSDRWVSVTDLAEKEVATLERLIAKYHQAFKL